ncbi:Small RNA degrading nuclease 2 [Trichoderma ghanense]|uniref:Small RNA degrading nuclease 2 n=1 Tax=Trichoderma ghanense TaxID=65468 RepID=A0ABY2GWS3_9HYPO
MAAFHCSVCSQSFQTRPKIYNHALSTGHDMNHCCEKCSRWFKTESDRKAHMNSPIHVKEAAKPMSNSPNASVGQSNQPFINAPPVVPLRFGRVTYTRLERNEQEAVYSKLLARCHSVESLANEGYTVDLEKGPTTKPKKPRPSLADFRQTPMRQPAVKKRRAVVIDCEMAEAVDGSDELISLCAIDFLTGGTLVNNLVIPSRPIKDWRTNIHGIGVPELYEAIMNQEALSGWIAARQELWKHIDETTILIGQTICYDFEALRLVHTRVVDSAILATEAVFNNLAGRKKPGRRWGLQELCKTFLGIEIRVEGGIHDNLEDVLAAREVVLQALLKPAKFQTWADKARKDFWKPKAGNKKVNRKGTTKTPHSTGYAIPESYTLEYDWYSDDGWLGPEDFEEWLWHSTW